MQNLDCTSHSGKPGFSLRIAWAAVLAVATLAAHAERSVYQLRYFEIETWRQQGHFDGEDLFNNGDPTTGISYGNGFAGGWIASPSFGPGAELNGPASDFLGKDGLGSLAFRYGDAGKSTTNLVPAGFDNYSLSLAASGVPNSSGLGLVHKDGGFSVFSAWDYGALQPGESLQLSINGTGAPNFVDRLTLRYGSRYDTGQAYISFQQDSRTGFPDNPFTTRTTLASTTPEAIYAVLTDVDYIALALERDAPTASNANPGVRGSVLFFDAVLNDAGDEPKILAEFTFGVEGTTFKTEGAGASGVFVAGNWLTPVAAVPEPGTCALWLAGLAGLAFTPRRRAT